jgi:hypothetical protein
MFWRHEKIDSNLSLNCFDSNQIKALQNSDIININFIITKIISHSYIKCKNLLWIIILCNVLYVLLISKLKSSVLIINELIYIK